MRLFSSKNFFMAASVFSVQMLRPKVAGFSSRTETLDHVDRVSKNLNVFEKIYLASYRTFFPTLSDIQYQAGDRSFNGFEKLGSKLSIVGAATVATFAFVFIKNRGNLVPKDFKDNKELEKENEKLKQEKEAAEKRAEDLMKANQVLVESQKECDAKVKDVLEKIEELEDLCKQGRGSDVVF